eukprot:TRINITY_DN5435_c0_g1_i1.p1 TRINITY_DN5435_c0_g1~~TRINITY_DN5435_c0_g1_i1.p1  ORF type:complete len:250 (+),score=47.81 TRINITY_DN5435_c0_g1_i1:83-751(+)
MANFDKYDEEYQHIINTISRKLKQLPNFAGERRKIAIKETEKEIEDAEQLIKQMDIDAANHPMRARLQPRIRTYQQDLIGHRRELQRAVTMPSSNSMRDDLFSGASQDYQVQYQDQRAAILAGNAKLDVTSERLANAHRLGVESENIGASVLGELHGQRQQIIRATNKLDEVDDSMKSGRTILRGMARRVVTNKLILMIIIILLLIAIGLIIYLKWLRPISK